MPSLPRRKGDDASRGSDAKRVDGKRFAACALFLWLAVMLVYARVAWNEFIDFDTAQYITSNSHVRRGLSLDGLRWALTTGHASNWHPLTWLSHMLDVQLFGLEPRGHHLMNAALHGVATVLLFAWLAGLTGAIAKSLFVALLFAFHPAHVESVAWIVERKDVLSAAFAFATLIAYTRYVRGVRLGGRPSGRAAYALALVLFALGLASKPMLVTLPCVLLLLDAWPLGRASEGARKLVLEKLPFFALAAASSLVTYLVQSGAGATTTLERLPISARAMNAVTSYAAYLGKLVWPTKLAIFYPHTHTEQPVMRAALALLLLLAITAVALRARRSRPYLLVGWLWFLGTLVPVIGLVQVGGQAMADRYTYLPYVGLFVAIVWGVGDLASASARPAVVGGAIAVCALAAASVRQIGTWKDTRTLSEHALLVTEDNYLAHNMLGFDLAESGDIDGASRHFREALRIFPRYVNAMYNLGIALERQEKPDEALAQYEAALALDPDDPRVHTRVVAILERRGRYAEALPHLEAIARAAPENPLLQLSLGDFLLATKRTAESQAAYLRALELARASGDPALLAKVEKRLGPAHRAALEQARRAALEDAPPK